MTAPPSPSRRRALTALAAGLAGWPALARAGGPSLLQLSPRPENYETPREAFTERITPVASFYIRSHHDRPAVDPATWRLAVTGQVARPRSLTLAELARLPQVEVEAVLQCAGNGRALFEPRMPGVQWRRGAMGNALWRGPRLRDVLAMAGPGGDAAHVVMEGADRPALAATPAFVRSIPLAKALHEDTLVATHMNGAPLTPSHGAPARVVVPGWVGDDWLKWVTTLTLSPTEATGFFSEKAYRFPAPLGAPGEPVPPERMRPMTRLTVKSVIASPGPGAVLRPGRVEVVGVAFSGEAEVARVEVSRDGGATWLAARLEGPSTRHGWRVFRATVELGDPGSYILAARATDARGDTQPARPRWNPSGYLFDAVDPVAVEVRT